ncbi:MAG: hypothetical protein RLZZ584_1165 [Pseudomonadota bacterium]|jgi:phospholipid transport system transporter-binding protein
MSAAATTALPATLTVVQARVELGRLSAALDATPRGASLALDASALQHFDSSALAVLLELRRRAQARGCGVALGGLPPRLAELARLYGVAGLVGA